MHYEAFVGTFHHINAPMTRFLLVSGTVPSSSLKTALPEPCDGPWLCIRAAHILSGPFGVCGCSAKPWYRLLWLHLDTRTTWLGFGDYGGVWHLVWDGSMYESLLLTLTSTRLWTVLLCKLGRLVHSLLHSIFTVFQPERLKCKRVNESGLVWQTLAEDKRELLFRKEANLTLCHCKK